MYGPTVLITTLVDSAIARTDAGSVESATITGRSASAESISASLARVCSSFAGLRPAIAHRAPAA